MQTVCRESNHAAYDMQQVKCTAIRGANVAHAKLRISFGHGDLRHLGGRGVLHVANASNPGGSVLDKPLVTTPDINRKNLRKRPPIYRVLLHNDNYNRREYVVQVLLKVVEGYTVEDAVNVMQEAHINGLALVTTCPQEEAERYCEGMRNSGLVSTVEPAGSSGGGGNS